MEAQTFIALRLLPLINVNRSDPLKILLDSNQSSSPLPIQINCPPSKRLRSEAPLPGSLGSRPSAKQWRVQTGIITHRLDINRNQNGCGSYQPGHCQDQVSQTNKPGLAMMEFLERLAQGGHRLVPERRSGAKWKTTLKEGCAVELLACRSRGQLLRLYRWLGYRPGKPGCPGIW